MEQLQTRRQEFNDIKLRLSRLDEDASKYLREDKLKVFSMAVKNIMDKYPYFEHYIRLEEQGFGKQTEQIYRESVVGFVNSWVENIDSMIELAKDN